MLAARANWPLSRVDTFGRTEAAEYLDGSFSESAELNEWKRDAVSSEGPKKATVRWAEDVVESN